MFGRIRLCETNQKLALAPVEGLGVGFSTRRSARAILVAPEIKEQL
jgi:hypothetical protein